VKGLVPVAMLLIGRGRPREHPKGHFRSKVPIRADLAQLPVAHARSQRELPSVVTCSVTTGDVS
jgi:hypothetical protein